MAAEARRAPNVVREQSFAPDVPGFYPDPEDDMSGLLAWTDDVGRFFMFDEQGHAREYKDGEPLPGMEPPARSPLWRRVLKAIEPWYNWGTLSVERMQGMRLVDGAITPEADGDVAFFELQWFGLHLEIQIGRTPKAVR